jgi:hypothetical protein
VINPNDIRSALEQQFNAFNAANPVTIDGVYDDEEMDVVRENTAYMPQIGRPYQRTHLLPADTQQPEKGGNGVTLESGIFQIDLNYPVGGGAGDAAARAHLVRQYFKRTSVISFNGVTVQVREVPSIKPASTGSDWYKLVVSVPYFVYG